MKLQLRLAAAIALMTAAASAQAQFNRLKGATIAVSATNEWTTPLTNDATPVTAIVGTPPTALRETVYNQNQGATSKPGVMASFGFHPVAWAGVEVNYQFAQFEEQYSFNYAGQPATQYQRVGVAFHEATAAYQFHPPHIKFQPYVNIGGGAVDFLPYLATNQWRAAGLVETGFDIPLMKSNHLAMRIQGRALIYRAPNFNNSAISTRSWVATEEPTVGFAYHF